MALPDPAQPYWQQQQQINAATVAVATRLWQTSGGDRSRWEASLTLLMATITRAQIAAVLLALKYVKDVLADLLIGEAPLAAVDPTPLIGLSGAGLPLLDLYANLPEQFTLNTTRASQLLDAEPANVPSPQVFGLAMKATTAQLQRSVQTAISDTGRAGESLQIAVTPGVGYVRMLNPPSCKRCVVLAGKFYQWNAGFARHPLCDCRHVPAAESVAGDLRVDPERYFRSLTVEGQDAAFGKAGAEAIRDGADIGQVVNADKGMQVAQVYGRSLKVTTQGTTKRGRAGKAIRARGRSPATTPRLMPSSIYRLAENRTDAVRLLRLNGYIADDDSGVVDLDAVLARNT
jgi:hypothetical protein